MEKFEDKAPGQNSQSFWLSILLSPRRRVVALNTAYGVIAISIITIIATVLLHVIGIWGGASFPKLHGDISKQPLTTFADTLNYSAPADVAPFKNSQCQKLSSTWVADENKRVGLPTTGPGAIDWPNFDLSFARGSALWVDKNSASCGDTVGIHASLYNTSALEKFDPQPRSIQVLRIGWYQGSGAREVFTTKPIALKQEKIPAPSGNVRVIETKWPVTYQLTIGKDWVPGFYLITTINKDGIREAAAPLVIRSPLASSKLALIHSFITWNAYSTFGGYSLYFGKGSTITERRAGRSRVASFDRPILGSGGFHIHRDALPLVQFIEKQGINYDQYSDTYINQWPSVIKSYNGIVLSGHAEYMTRRIFDALISARNHGTNLAIFGANTAYWQTRLVATKYGPNRRIVMYRDAKEDPVSDPRQVTLQFSDPRINTPSSLLNGSITDGVHVSGTLSVVTMPQWLGLPQSTTISHLSPDSEVESIAGGAASAPNIHTIFSGEMKYRDANNPRALKSLKSLAQTSWFVTPSGAAVFNAGISTWPCELMETCAYSKVDFETRNTLQTITAKVLTLWQKREVGATLK